MQYALDVRMCAFLSFTFNYYFISYYFTIKSVVLSMITFADVLQKYLKLNVLYTFFFFYFYSECINVPKGV